MPKSSLACRVVVLGAPASGKTALIRRYLKNEFIETYDPTIEDKYKKSLSTQGKKLKLEILDTAGKELVVDMLSRYIESGDAFVLVYSVTSRESFEQVIHLYRRIANRNAQKMVSVMLIGCQCDSPYREVFPQDGEELSAQIGASFAETSARYNVNVQEAFEEVGLQLVYLESHMPAKDWKTSDNVCCFM